VTLTPFRFWRRHHHPIRPQLTVGGVAVELIPKENIHMATTINVGQTLPLSVKYLDASGNDITADVTPDAPPAWTDTTPVTDTLTGFGSTATALGLAAGTDVITMDVTVGGVAFSATLDLTVAALVPVVASVEIVAGTPTP
jgi:hypothetical protein